MVTLARMRGCNRGAGRLPVDLREKMIQETNAFLTWALRHTASVPRIPRRRVDTGGFSVLLRRPGVRQHLEQWWYRTLDQLGSIG